MYLYLGHHGNEKPIQLVAKAVMLWVFYSNQHLYGLSTS